MLLEGNADRLHWLTQQMESLLKKEQKNVLETLKLVRKDSSLGFEPSMEYIGGENGLLWKLKHLDWVVNMELPAYRRR